MEKAKKVRFEVEELKEVMITNVEKVLLNQQKAELLVETSEDLAKQTGVFKKTARITKEKVSRGGCLRRLFCCCC
jgi:hypothetical protein